MSITQGELAREFKVSQMTVSRALRGSQGVGKKLKTAILRKARELGYNPEASFEARALRRRASGTRHETNVICVIVWDMDSADGKSATFNHRILKGVLTGARAAGNEVIVAPHVQSVLPRVVLRRQVDGVIWLLGDENLLHGMTECPVPWVSLLFDVPNADVVAIDAAAAARAIGQHLTALGHRQVAFVGPESPLAHERLAGLRAGLREGGGDVAAEAVCLEPFAMSPKSTRQLMDRLWQQTVTDRKRPWSVVAAYNDYMAISVIEYLRGKGLRVPGDVSVTGFDGFLPDNEQSPSPITTATVPLEDIGAEAVQVLDWRLKHPDAPRRRLLLEAPFAARATTGPAARLPG